MKINESLMNKDYHLTEMTVKGKPARIYDNCLRFDIFWKMQNALLGVDIPWYYNDEVSNQEVKTPIEGYEERENVIDLYNCH